MLNKLKGTPYLLLKDFFEYEVGKILFKVFPNNSFKDVFPELPVIAIALIFELFLIDLAHSVKKFNELLVFIFL